MSEKKFNFQDIEIIKSKNSTNLFEIKKFEKKLNIELPKDYIEWLLQYNGGRPEKDGCDVIEMISEVSDGFLVNWFYGLKYDPTYNESYELYDSYESFFDRMPKELIPIACDPGGNQICLGVVKGEHYGKVYFWDHEEEAQNFVVPEEIETPWWENVYLVANSFEEFINKLYKYELPEELEEEGEKEKEKTTSSDKPKSANDNDSEKNNEKS
jgi:hypothetical protein